MPVISLDAVGHVYGHGAAARRVLVDVTMTLSESRIGVVGANGSGKSTFARLLNGLVLPTEGTVTVDGLGTARDGAAVRRRVGFCFTDPDAQIVMPTVAEDVAFSLRRHGLSREEVQARVTDLLVELGLADHADPPAHQLSGGQKQLLALASVLILDPDILVLDEPTTLLDLRNSRRFGERLAGLRQQVVLVTHQLDQLTDFDRVIVFEEGRVIADGEPDVALAAYREVVG